MIENERRLPWLSRVLLVRPRAIEAALDRVAASGKVRPVPSAWQVSLGILRMWHRALFRSDTIGTSSAPKRGTPFARLCAARPLRFPFLVRERAIAPLDFSGLLSGRERVLRHLIAAHHDGSQFAYDLEMLSLSAGALDELVARVARVVSGEDPRSAYLRDLVVFEGYHEALLAAAERARAGDLGLSPEEARDPDISFFGYLAWCVAQPESLRETIAEAVTGRFTLKEGRAC